MGILDDVVINAKTAAEAVGKKAGQIVDVSKLRFNVAELNAEISKRYEALGEYVYENCREALAEDAESVGKMAEIDELVNQRNILTKELVDKQTDSLRFYYLGNNYKTNRLSSLPLINTGYYYILRNYRKNNR